MCRTCGTRVPGYLGVGRKFGCPGCLPALHVCPTWKFAPHGSFEDSPWAPDSHGWQTARPLRLPNPSKPLQLLFPANFQGASTSRALQLLCPKYFLTGNVTGTFHIYFKFVFPFQSISCRRTCLFGCLGIQEHKHKHFAPEAFCRGPRT